MLEPVMRSFRSDRPRVSSIFKMVPRASGDDNDGPRIPARRSLTC
jgi:hypothetical protein